MTRIFPRVSIIALGVATFVSLSPLSAARADTSALGAPAPSSAEPDFWLESGPDEATVVQRPAARHRVRHNARDYAWRHRYRDNPVAAAASGVAGGVADLGSLAAYPFYCFPNYGSCSFRWPYQF